MQDAPPAANSQVLRLMLVDRDPVFRAGLRVWLDQFSDLELVAEAADRLGALSGLTERSVDLVLLSLNLGSDTEPDAALALCRQVKRHFPTLPILILSHYLEPIMQAAARQAGANGYCAKGAEEVELIEAIWSTATGEADWFVSSRLLQPIQVLPSASSRSTAAPLTAPAATPAAIPLTTPLTRTWNRFRGSLRQAGLQQINETLTAVGTELQYPDLSLIDRLFLEGQQRELRAARWLVERLLLSRPVDRFSEQSTHKTVNVYDQTILLNRATTENSSQNDRQNVPTTSDPSALTNRSDAAMAIPPWREVRSVLLDAVLAKLQTSLENYTDMPLETDILREDKKRELFYVVLRQFENTLDELRHSQMTPDQLSQTRSTLLVDLWQITMIEFFGKYATIRLAEQTIGMVDLLLPEMNVVQAEILAEIPGVTDLIAHLLFDSSLTIDSQSYPPGNPESLARAELLLENLIIQVANAVVQPLLNRLGNIEEIKQTFYDRRLLSTREIERFRNNLSWRYRLEAYVKRPKDMFESQYRLFALSGRGIKLTTIYAPRTDELATLSGIPLAVTLALEARDAIAPRLRSVISFVGNGLVYVLTDVIGRGLGLIGRGILKGVGNALQDKR